MTTNLSLETELSLYADTICRNTGQYFCNKKQFSLPRTGNRVSVLASGQEVFEKIHAALTGARHFIWIADWQMAFDVELVERGNKDHPGQLYKILKKIISTKPVHIRVLLYRSLADGTPGTYDGMVADKLNDLNKKNYPGSILVLLESPTSSQRDSFDYSHHQKFVVVDGRIGFIGGMDLTYGRWETPGYDVVVDPERFVINDMYNPCATKLRPMSITEQEKVEKDKFIEPYGDKLIEEGCQPRMPWQDVHIKIAGPSVLDMHRNFARRWNGLLTRKGHRASLSGVLYRLLTNADRIEKPWLEKIGAWPVLQATQPLKEGGAQVQIVRSVSSKHLANEGVKPDDLLLYPTARERKVWEECLEAWRGLHQDNILDAMVNCILSANNYVYIESQYFISQFGSWGETKKDMATGHMGQHSAEREANTMGNENEGIQNTIMAALGKRIADNIDANLPFHVYLVFPAHPEGVITDESIYKQQWQLQATVKHGNSSLIKRIQKALKHNKRDPEEWVQYLTVLNMRNYGATVQYARAPETFNEDYHIEIGRYVVTEQIYIHSKMMIVDDAVAIVGSANINDRSLTGNGDTEIAAVVVDTEGVELQDLGSPDFKVQTRGFARELRRQLWEKHFGFSVVSVDEDKTTYVKSTVRATRPRETDKTIPVHPIIHPPRLTMTEGQFNEPLKKLKWTWQQILNKPCHPNTVKAIQMIAQRNAEVYEEVFQHTPRNSMGSHAGISQFYTQPYLVTVGIADDPKDSTGVLPPALQLPFMTTQIPNHLRNALNPGRPRHQLRLYDGHTIHNIEKALGYLKDNLIGFFVAAPLDWGMAAKIDGNPSKSNSVKVDIAQSEEAAGQPKGG